jgi:hypothetical protein
MQLGEDAMMKLSRLILLLGMGFSGAGCISMPKMLPAEYFEPKRTITVEVVHCAESPVLRTDQPVNHFAGATWIARNEAMRNRMAGITPEKIPRAVEKELVKPLKDMFTVAGADAQLALKVSVNEWGGFVPTGRYGESTDIPSFQFPPSRSAAPRRSSTSTRHRTARRSTPPATARIRPSAAI